jgi:hypothetical protein
MHGLRRLAPIAEPHSFSFASSESSRRPRR